MGKEKKYWSSIQEIDRTPEFIESMSNEFAEELPVADFLADDKLQEANTGRRDFLKFLGFSVAAASLAACEAPVIKSIPYVNKPQEITPGVANYYASTFYDGNDYANILVKTREGRPIFIKSNTESGLANGAVNARILASVLGLYDSARLSSPQIDGADASWNDLDSAVQGSLNSGKTVLLTNTIISPSTQRVISNFVTKTGAKHVIYDAISYSGIRRAHSKSHGKASIPSYDFSKANTIVSINADFLGTWLTDNIFSSQYAASRKLDDKMAKHFHFEATMSLTGSNADHRTPIKPSQEGLVAAAIYNGLNGGGNAGLSEDVMKGVNAAVEALSKDKGQSLVVSGSNDENVQLIVNAINKHLGNYNNTLSIDNPISLFQGDENQMNNLVSDMGAGQIDNLIIYGCNPAYDYFDTASFNAGLAKVKTSVCFNLYKDETGVQCKYLAPDHHYLESWGDFSLINGRVDLQQPTISPLGNTRSAQESLLSWIGDTTDYYTFMRKTHNGDYTSAMFSTDKKWNNSLASGTMSTNRKVVAVPVIEGEEQEIIGGLNGQSISSAINAVKSIKGGEWEVSFYQKVSMGNGSGASNPWLQELPDPMTKVTWDNYITMSPAYMKQNDFNTHLGIDFPASTATVTINGKELTLPVFPAAGQAPGTIGIALGYGRGKGTNDLGKAAYQTGGKGEHLMDGENLVPVGKNAYEYLAKNSSGTIQYNASATLVKAADEYPIATTQMQQTVMGRESIVRETVLGSYLSEKDKKRGKASWNKEFVLATHVHGETVDKNIKEFDLWQEFPVEDVGHRWGMSIDLTTCTGCSACVVACHSENNVPVVGKNEVLRHRDMHWMRIDRYFSSDYDKAGDIPVEEGGGGLMIDAYKRMEVAAANPETVHLPMMCQHCNHAPCETVCPVAATTHSNEGLNMMAYNRCIGTRYCANNCPYKVRRFNWFNYTGYKKFKNVNPSQDALTRMVLNPDVVVRTRGVMEKCSMCVQRIQAGKLEAKKDGTPVQDGSIVSACAEACPTNAITFGDLNDKKSKVRGLADNVRSYRILEEVGTQSNMYYMTKIRNKG